MEAKEFDFKGVINGGGFNSFSAFIVHQAHTDGDDVALVFVTHEDERAFSLTESLILIFEAGDIVFAGEDGFNSGGDFLVIVEGIFFRGRGLDELEEAAGDATGGSTAGEWPGSRPG